jgi:hypothetical protein
MTAEFVWIKYTAPVSAKLSFKFALSFSMKLEAVSDLIYGFLTKNCILLWQV